MPVSSVPASKLAASKPPKLTAPSTIGLWVLWSTGTRLEVQSTVAGRAVPTPRRRHHRQGFALPRPHLPPLRRQDLIAAPGVEGVQQRQQRPPPWLRYGSRSAGAAGAAVGDSLPHGPRLCPEWRLYRWRLPVRPRLRRGTV